MLHKKTPGGNASIITLRHISFRVPQPGSTGSLSPLVSYSHVRRSCELPVKTGGSA